MFSSPAVANGVVYVGSDDHKLYAFSAAGTTGCSGNPKSCAPLWTATTGGRVQSSPAVANGLVYVGSDDTDLYAFDANGVTGLQRRTEDVHTAARRRHGHVRRHVVTRDRERDGLRRFFRNPRLPPALRTSI